MSSNGFVHAILSCRRPAATKPESIDNHDGNTLAAALSENLAADEAKVTQWSASLRKAATIARMPALTASGRCGQAATTWAKSGGTSAAFSALPAAR